MLLFPEEKAYFLAENVVIICKEAILELLEKLSS